MSELICLDEQYSTTRMLTKKLPDTNSDEDSRTKTVLSYPIGNGRQGRGGLRHKGYFKSGAHNKPLITVVTVVFNGAEFLEETIKSIINQTYSNVEYIIIDGGSTDGTQDIILKYEHAIDYWVSESDHGIYDAMNKAVKLASTGAYVLFLGAGDRVLKLPDAEAINSAHKSGTHLLFGDVLIGNKLFSSTFNGKLRYRNTLHHQGMFLLNIPTSTPWFDERLKIFADWDLNLSLFQRGVVVKNLGFTVAYAEPDGVSARLHLTEIMRMINHRCGPFMALAAAFYHGSLHLLR